MHDLVLTRTRVNDFNGSYVCKVASVSFPAFLDLSFQPKEIKEVSLVRYVCYVFYVVMRLHHAHWNSHYLILILVKILVQI